MELGQQRAEWRVIELGWPERADDGQLLCVRHRQYMLEEQHRGIVGGMEILEHEHKWDLLCNFGEQVRNRDEQPMARTFVLLSESRSELRLAGGEPRCNSRKHRAVDLEMVLDHAARDPEE